MESVDIINLNTQPAIKSVKDLRQALKACKDSMAGLEEGSDAFLELAQNAGALKHKLDEINESVSAASSDFGDMLTNATTVTNGLIGGFTAAQGALSLFGVESEEVVESIKKLQALMAIGQGIDQIDKLTKALPKLTKAITGTTVAAKVLRTVLQPKWLLAITAGVTAIVAIYNKWKKSTEDQTKANDKLATSIKKIEIPHSTYITNLQKELDIRRSMGTYSNEDLLKGEIELRQQTAAALEDQIAKEEENYTNLTKFTEEGLKQLKEERKQYASNSKEYETLSNRIVAYMYNLEHSTYSEKNNQDALEAKNKELEELRKEQEDNTKALEKATYDLDVYTEAQKRSTKSVGQAAKEIDKYTQGMNALRLANAQVNLQELKGSTTSREAALQRILFKKQELKLIEEQYGKEHYYYAEAEVELEKMNKAYEDSYLKLEKLATGVLKTPNLFSSFSVEFEDALISLADNFETLQKAINTKGVLGTTRFVEAWWHLSESIVDVTGVTKENFDDLKKSIDHYIDSGELTEPLISTSKIYVQLGADIQKNINSTTLAFKQGLINTEQAVDEYAWILKNAIIYNNSLKDIVGDNNALYQLFPAEDYLGRTQAVMQQVFEDDPIAYLTTVKDATSRLADELETNLSETIGRMEEQINALQILKDTVHDIKNELDLSSLNDNEAFSENLKLQQQVLEQALQNKLISQQEYYDTVEKLDKLSAQHQINNSVAVAGSISSILNSIADGMDENNERQFEASKKMRIASATIDMLAGITAAVSGLFTTKSGPWDIALAALQAAAIAASGGANIAKISREKYTSSSSSTSASTAAVAQTITTPTQISNAVQSANIQSAIGDTRVYVLESDITSTGNRVSVQEQENRY